MNESVLNLTAYDIKDEIIINELNLIEDNNLSFINNQKDQTNLEITIDELTERKYSENNENNDEVKIKIIEEKEDDKIFKIFNEKEKEKITTGKKNIIKILKNKENIKNNTKITKIIKEDNTMLNKNLKQSQTLRSFNSISNLKNAFKKTPPLLKNSMTTPQKKPMTTSSSNNLTNKNYNSNNPNDIRKSLIKSNTLQLIKPTISKESLTLKKIDSKSKVEDLNKFINSTKIVKKIIPLASSLTNPLFYPTRKSFNVTQSALTEFFSEKMDDILNDDFLDNFKDSLVKLLDIDQESENLMENYKEEVLEYINTLFEDKLQKIIFTNQKYENEIQKLEELIDCKNPNNVNNKVYQAVIGDKENEIREIEEEFKIKKEEGIQRINNKLKERNSQILDITQDKTLGLKKEISYELKSKIMECFANQRNSLTPRSSSKNNMQMSFIENNKSKFNSSINLNSTINNSTMSQKRNTISSFKRSMTNKNDIS